MDIKREKINIIFCKFVEIIMLILSVGKKPPPETKVILILSELYNLTPEKLSKVRIIILREE